MWVKCMKNCFLELTVRKISDLLSEASLRVNPLVAQFSCIFLIDSQVKEKIANF